MSKSPIKGVHFEYVDEKTIMWSIGGVATYVLHRLLFDRTS